MKDNPWDGRERREMDKVLSDIKEINLRTAIEVKYLGDRIEQVHKRSKESDESITTKLAELSKQIFGDGNGFKGIRLKVSDLEGMQKDLREHMKEDQRQLANIQKIIWVGVGAMTVISFVAPIAVKMISQKFF